MNWKEIKKWVIATVCVLGIVCLMGLFAWAFANNLVVALSIAFVGVIIWIIVSFKKEILD